MVANLKYSTGVINIRQCLCRNVSDGAHKAQHSALICVYVYMCNENSKEESEYRFIRKINEQNVCAFKSHLDAINWNDVTMCTDVDVAYDCFF